MNHRSDISTYVSYDYTKFGDNSSILPEEDVWGVEEISAEKINFHWK